jgi:putative endopeptidase
MKTLLLSAAAAAALTLSVASASANDAGHEDHLCLDEACVTQSLFDFADAAPGGAAPISLESPRYGAWGFDLTGRDTAAKPGEDFYRFANGAWDDRTQIPSDRTRFGNFDALAILSEARVRAILEDAAAGKLKDKDAAKIGAAWNTFMDEARAEKLDAKPIAPKLAAIRKVKSHDDMTALQGKAPGGGGYQSILGVGIADDAKNPSRYAVYAGTGGMGLPDRDYYLDAKFAPQKAAYEAYIAQMLTMIGWDNPAQAAKDIVAYETRIAEATWTRAERRNRDKTYNPKTLAELQAISPGFSWDRYFADSGLPAREQVIVTTDTAFPKLAAVYAETPLDTLKAWQAFHITDGAAPLLSKRFVDAHFAFRGKTLNGQPEQQPRWKRGVAHVNGLMGESVGRVYVARYFPPESKAKMDALVGDIRTAMKLRIEKLDWMGPETKVKALDKLAKFGVKIGYPTVWKDYRKLRVAKGDLYGNASRAAAWDWKRRVARIDRPVDKTEWSMTPQTVNAYYNSVKNEIVFPAAILQAPFFHPDADPAINYGGIGGVIGHEISHGFDDQGSKSDGDGVLTNWWAPEDQAKFKAQGDRLDAQYSLFEPLPGYKINGRLTLGENIGDMGGLSLALDAYRISLDGKPSPVLDGTTGDQRVFYGWAQVWRSKIRDEALKQRLVSDSHSPGYYRVNGTIRNLDAWYEAFEVKEGDKLYVKPEDRVRIW